VIGEIPNETTRDGTVVVAHDGDSVSRLAHIELDEVDAEGDRIAVALRGCSTVHHMAAAMRADQRLHGT
jgi:hypothetical protein